MKNRIDKGKLFFFEKSNKRDAALVRLVQVTSLGNLSSQSQKKGEMLSDAEVMQRSSGAFSGPGIPSTLCLGRQCLVFIAV